MAVRPRLNSRESWSLGRKKRRRARNTLPKRRLGRVASDFCPVVVSHSGGLQISGGHVIERPCHLGEVALVFAAPESTSRAERPATMAEKSGKCRRWPVHLGCVFGGMGRAEGERRTCPKHSNQVPPRESRLRYVPGGNFHPGGTQTIGDEIIQRCCCFGRKAFVIAPPESASRADESNVGEEIERSGISAAAPSRLPPGGIHRADRTKPTPAHQVRENATTAELPWLLSRRS